MCEPASLTMAGLALTVVATGVSTYAAYEQQQSQNKANEYNASVAERNQENANASAQQAIEQGKIDEANHLKKVRQLEGSQEAAGAANGLLVGDGTLLQATQDTAGYGKLDALTIRSNAAREAWGIQNNAADYGAQATLSRMKSSSPLLPAASSFLGGASSFAGGLASYQKTYGTPSRPASVKAYAV
jgi:hypothetical protein